MSCGVKENYGNIYLMKEKIANKTNPLGHSKSRSTSAPLCPHNPLSSEPQTSSI